MVIHVVEEEVLKTMSEGPVISSYGLKETDFILELHLLCGQSEKAPFYFSGLWKYHVTNNSSKHNLSMQ